MAGSRTRRPRGRKTGGATTVSIGGTTQSAFAEAMGKRNRRAETRKPTATKKTERTGDDGPEDRDR